MTAPWTDAQRRRSIEADLTELRSERRAALLRKERDLTDEVRGLELQYAARADACRCDDELAVIDRQIDEGLEALHALPTQRQP